ncbi:MAG TPA: hypothetical protein EYQ61_11145 [Dehalococcoidia bacterium]|nr:hypothetical protein [Dehalococcoidia bacterium]HIK88367.1 hypothetical protein [Dehalococcoidia bacterium]
MAGRNVMTIRPLTKFALLFAVLTTLTLALAACGGGAAKDAENFVQVRTAPADYTIDDLKDFGMKTSKQYKVEGLPDGLDAWKGFWGTDPYDRHDYEIRFYESHDIAISSGKQLAIDATGAEFEAKRDEQVWTVGVKDRWQARGVTDVSSGGSRQAPGPTYQDWAIVGNMVILCDGLDSEQAILRCADLIDHFLPGDAG